MSITARISELTENELDFLNCVENMIAYLSEHELFASCDQCLQVLEALYFIDRALLHVYLDRNPDAAADGFHFVDTDNLLALLAEFLTIAFAADPWLFAAKLMDCNRLFSVFENVWLFSDELWVEYQYPHPVTEAP